MSSNQSIRRQSGLDPRTPVLIGVAQINRRLPDERDAVDLMVDAVRMAFDDTAASSKLAAAVDLIAVLDGLWSWRDPGRLIAAHLGADRARSCLTSFGGQTPQTLTAALCSRILASEIDLAVICGGEINHTRRRARSRGVTLARQPEPADARSNEVFGEPLDMGNDHETALGLAHPAHSYALIESILMARSGRSIATHRHELGRLWAGFAAAAAANPHAAVRSCPDAAKIIEPSSANRWVAWPYTKALCANNDVDMSAAVVICSVERARRLGVPADRWVFPHAAVETAEVSGLSERPGLGDSPALEQAGRAVLELAGVGPEDLGPIELYGCFPAVVQMTVDALGLDPDRPLSVSGGLAFAGSPMNTSTLHGLCALVERLRAEPNSVGLLQGNGGHVAKHAFGVYGGAPARAGYRSQRCDPSRGPAGAGGSPRAVAAPDATGAVMIEGYTVLYDQSGPVRAVAATLFDDGTRAWASSRDSAVFEYLTTGIRIGEPVHIAGGVLLGDALRSGLHSPRHRARST